MGILPILTAVYPAIKKLRKTGRFGNSFALAIRHFTSAERFRLPFAGAFIPSIQQWKFSKTRGFRPRNVTQR
jgi:hypothetical protein